ncbi:pyridoxamine 5'-phosphate oxidase family protein [uncultured Phycicoccus sp.]|uniref:pyridoxamine 5'-phosphate oxidase family protein n=1 Tax=uncultured Phycicoccus sp. TaxID=661422 RepID=UPI0026263268|nr:pyridoxamine 5'-phosphate oxidase family protein [uncultured Phycicoccus sp.]
MNTETTPPTAGAGPPGPDDVEVLDPAQCWAILREAPFGRLGVIVDERPEIFPVNHIVDHGSIVFRSAAGTKVAAAVGSRVVFEVDGYDLTAGRAWSVMVSGPARKVTDTDDLIDVMQAPLDPWHQGAKPHFVRIVTESVTGRRYPVSGGART